MMRFSLILVLAFLVVPSGVGAQTTVATTTVATTTSLEVSGWIPYWRVHEGIRDARKHLEKIDIINPFAFSVTTSGKLQDLAGLNQSVWTRFFRDARAEGVAIIPTIMWSDTNAIHTVLSKESSRAYHIRRIVSMVEKGKYDGVDIDYEGKLADTRESFALFLGELKKALKGKTLSCTIEARTPPADLYPAGKVPEVMEYANDYTALNEHCDRVNIMAYDQQRADLTLNKARTGAPYYPVSDTAWAEKVLAFAKESIDADKLVLSVPTYGREVEVVVAPEWYKEYRQLWSVSEEYALATAEEYDVVPMRNPADELSFTYIPNTSPYKAVLGVTGTTTGMAAATRALEYASRTGETVSVNMVWWSDSESIAKKIALAKAMGVRGIAIFKIDGGEDQDIWSLFE